MVADYLGADADQEDIVYYIYGDTDNHSGSITKIVKALAWYNIESTKKSNYVSFGKIEDQINNNQPLMALVYDSGDGHVLVIRGYYENTSTDVCRVYYIDPADGEYHIKTYANFKSCSDWDWEKTVYNIYVD